MQIAVALASIAILLGLMAAVRRLSELWNISPEVQRKLVHIGTGIYALTLPWLFPDRWPVYFLVGLTLIVMLALRMPHSKLGGTLHGVERQSYGDLLLAVSVGLCLFLAGEQLFLYVLPIAILTLADAAAALAGSAYGTRFFRIEAGQKSVEGSVVFFFVSMLISVICLIMMTPLAAPNIIMLSVMVAGFGTLVEAASWRGFDNLFLPLGLLIFLYVHMDSSLTDLVLLAVLFGAAIVVFLAIAPKFGLTRHAASVYVTTVFLLLAVTAVQNTIIPIMVLAAHAWCRSATPCESKFPDLDIVAALALVSFGWLTIGNATGWNAVSFYGMTAMGMVMALCAIALSGRPISIQITSLVLIAVTLLGIRSLALGLNPEVANWNGSMILISGVGIVLAAMLPIVAPHLFLQARVARLTVLSLIVPLGTFLVSISFADAVA